MGEKRKVSMSCANSECSHFRKRFRGNIIKFGTQSNGNKRFKCTKCNKTFGKTKHTPRFYKHMSKEEFIEICKMFAKNNSYRSISRKTNKHLDTIRGVAHRIREHHPISQTYYTKDLNLTEKERKSMWMFLVKRKNISD